MEFVLEVVLTVIIGFMVVNFIADIVYIRTKNKTIKVMKQQNELLWAVLKESNDISKELIKINLEKDGEKPDEVS